MVKASEMIENRVYVCVSGPIKGEKRIRIGDSLYIFGQSSIQQEHVLFYDRHNNFFELEQESMNLFEAIQALNQGKKVTHPDSKFENYFLSKSNKEVIYFIHKSNNANCDAFRFNESMVFEDGWIIYNPKKPVEVVIDKQYTAEISENGIKVGCTTFSFEKLKELNEGVKKFEAQV